MKKYLITSTHYTGAVEVVYNDELLLSIDFGQTNCTGVQRAKLKEMLPINISGLRAAFEKTSVTIIEGDFEVSFDMFWNNYGKKVHRLRVEKLWAKMSQADRVKAFVGIAKYKKWCQRSERFLLDPENYLKNQTWTNEY